MTPPTSPIHDHVATPTARGARSMTSAPSSARDETSAPRRPLSGAWHHGHHRPQVARLDGLGVELVRVERVIAVTIAVVRASGGLSSSSLPTGRADRADDIPAFVDKMLEEFTEGKDAEQHAVSQATG